MKITDEMIEAAALSDAEFDGRNFVCMGRVDRERYMLRAKASLTAALSASPAGVVKPLETAPSGPDAMMPSSVDVHEGAWAWVIGTNGKKAGWVDTHALFAHQLYRDGILSASPAGVVKDIDGGRFETWTLADFAAQCRMQSREQLDPEFSRFMAALANRLSKPSGINVKPLRFEEAKAGIWTSGLVLGGEYRIMLTASKGFQVSRGMIAIPDNQTWFPLLEIAEAAAFADYSARIMSAIEPAGVGVETPPPSSHVVPVDFAKLYSHPLAKQFHEAIQAADHLPCDSTDVVVKLGELKSSVEAEINRLLSNAKTDAKLLQQYHAWCVEHGCEPKTSDLYPALATTEGKDNG